MKIEKVNENKIKVTITLNDLEERNIDATTLSYNSPAAQELFWDMMEQAELKYGFNTSDVQLCVESIPDVEQGFIVTITKLNDLEDFESIHKYIKNKYRKNDLRIKRRSKKLFLPIAIYAFSCVDDLTSLSGQLINIYSGDSTLFKCSNIYYLILTKNNLCIENVRQFESILNEYGKRIINVNFYEGYLNEYGTKVIEYNAIQIINEFY